MNMYYLLFQATLIQNFMKRLLGIMSRSTRWPKQEVAKHKVSVLALSHISINIKLCPTFVVCLKLISLSLINLLFSLITNRK